MEITGVSHQHVETPGGRPPYTMALNSFDLPAHSPHIQPHRVTANESEVYVFVYNSDDALLERSGPIPPELGELSDLNELNLSGNRIMGEHAFTILNRRVCGRCSDRFGYCKIHSVSAWIRVLASCPDQARALFLSYGITILMMKL